MWKSFGSYQFAGRKYEKFAKRAVFFLEKPLFEGRNQLSTRETVSIKGRFEKVDVKRFLANYFKLQNLQDTGT